MSSEEDEYYYTCYHLSWYQGRRGGAPLIKKRSRVIASVAQNQVDVLKELLDSPKWYNVKDKGGHSLLQIAFLLRNKEVFDYMLSIPDFPTDCPSRDNKTTLGLALDRRVWRTERSSEIEYFPYELLKRGASIDFLCDKDNPPLLRALHQSFNNVALELIKRGADVNVHDNLGRTPILRALLMKVSATEMMEVVMTLLGEGAIPSEEEFEHSVVNDLPLFIQEILFLHSIDQYSELDFRVLVKLARNKSPLFHKIVKCTSAVKCDDCWYDSFIDLCMMEEDYLGIIIQKFGTCLAEFGRHTLLYRLRYAEEKLNIKNLDILLKSEFKFDVIYPAFSYGHLFDRLPNLPYVNESYVSEVYLYLLSYGLVLREEDLQFVYSKFGYCELFKLLLHMDFEQRQATGRKKHVVPVFVYDLTMDLRNFFRCSDHFRSDAIAHLGSYFFHPRLTQLSDKGSVVKSDIPRLLELARNSP